MSEMNHQCRRCLFGENIPHFYECAKAPGRPIRAVLAALTARPPRRAGFYLSDYCVAAMVVCGFLRWGGSKNYTLADWTTECEAGVSRVP